MAAAIGIIARQGLDAPTALIAKEAGVANGSLFNYFETKGELFNQLFLELKLEAVSLATDELLPDTDLKEQAFHVWSHWMKWAISYPEKRKALAQLSVSDEITATSHISAHQSLSSVRDLIARICAGGPLHEERMSFIMAIVESLSGTTMDFMIRYPDEAEKRCAAGFAILWKALT